MHYPISKPVHYGIAQVYSQPNDPNAQSLLTIAPKFRNHIYEYLLVDSRPITIMKDDEGRKTSNFRGDVAILHTCRQLYHETVGVLYVQNIFRFTHRIGSIEESNQIISSIDTCSRWMEEIGSCLLKLYTVKLNMDMPNIPKYRSLGIRDHLEAFAAHDTMILPLLHVFLSGVARNFSVEFESNATYSPRFLNLRNNQSSRNVELVNQVLLELGKQDTLGLKKTHHLLLDVNVERIGTRGTISYRSTHASKMVIRKFELSEKTQKFDLVPLPSPLTLVHLPDEVIATIAQYARTNHEITYNFITGTINGLGMLNVNKRCREIVRESYLRESHFTILLSSDTFQPHKEVYQRLKPRIVENFWRPFGFNWDSRRHKLPVQAAEDYGNAPTIAVQFEDDDRVYINAWDLLEVTVFFPHDTKIIVRIRGHSIDLHATTLGKIRTYVVALMEERYLKVNPDTRKDTIEVELNEQCLPVRVFCQKGDEGSEDVSSDIGRTVDRVDIFSLHDIVKTRAWRPCEKIPCWSVASGIYFPEKTTHGLVERLRRHGWVKSSSIRTIRKKRISKETHRNFIDLGRVY
jgi:hypothetical protein